MEVAPVVLLLVLVSGYTNGQLSPVIDELLNWCLDGVNHKSKPGPEDEMHMQCSPWKNYSCCTHSVTQDIHNTKLYNFDWDHCQHVKPMSGKCRTHFIQELCFYECDPNLGPWMAKVDMKIRKERFINVPLCASDCDAWFNSCSEDFTCVDNWTRKFVWRNRKNTCPIGSDCRTFKEVFHNSSQFCETIWDYSFKYTEDSKPCMRIWFDGRNGNPNRHVAQIRVDELVLLWTSGTHQLTGSQILIAIYTIVLAIGWVENF